VIVARLTRRSRLCDASPTNRKDGAWRRQTAAFSPNYIRLAVLRFIAGIGLGAEQPLCFAYAGEYAAKNIRGRFIAGVQMIRGAWSRPLSTLFALAFRDTLGWRGIHLGCGGTW